MKTSPILLIITGFAAGCTLLAADPTVGDSTNTSPAVAEQAAATNAPAAAAASTNAPGPKVVVENGAEGLRFNFRGAPLSLVLEHLSKAAGFIIDKQVTDIRGTVEIWSEQPVTKEEALELLASALKKNGYAFSRSGRILTIMGNDSIKTGDLPLNVGNKWEDMPKSDDVVTQIIPVKYASASQLVNTLQILLPTSATLTVNESANSILMVASQRDVRRIVRIVSAIDSSISGVTSIKVFALHYADSKQLATEITTLFSQQSGQGGGGAGARQFFNMLRGGPGGGGPFGGGGFGGMQNAGGGGSGASTAAGSKVSATSDDYSNSLIVSASEDMMKTIEDMVKEIDVPTTDITELRVFHLIHADPTEMADQLSQLFPDTTRSGSDNNNPFAFRFGPGGGGGRNNQATTNDRTKKKSQVMSVPDPRTSSLLVSAASEMMPHIADMIEKLDSIDARHEMVSVFDLRNADPQDVNQALSDLFNRNTKMTSSSSSSTSLLGSRNPLTQRATQQSTTSSSSTGFGNSGGGGGSRGGSSF